MWSMDGLLSPLNWLGVDLLAVWFSGIVGKHYFFARYGL